MKVSMIAAVAKNGVIGKDNDLAWHLPDDMKFFKSQTKGHVVIMGRKNWDSLPPQWRPLPHRTNIVITRNPQIEAKGANVVTHLQAALHLAESLSEEEAYIIGGGEIYKLGFPYASKLYITEIDGTPQGDTFFPEWDKTKWRETSRTHHPKDDSHAFDFDFVTYEKIEP